jgi:uncharacterized protein (DUF983 family)
MNTASKAEETKTLYQYSCDCCGDGIFYKHYPSKTIYTRPVCTECGDNTNVKMTGLTIVVPIEMMKWEQE